VSRRLAAILAASIAVLAGARSGVGQDDRLQQLIEANTQARGGREVLGAVQVIEYELTIDEPTFSVDAVYRADRQGRMRIDIYASGERVFSEGFDGARGWQWPGDAEHAMDPSPDGEAALRHGPQLPGHILGFHELEERGHRVELAGEEEFEGAHQPLLKVTLSDGHEAWYALDPESFLVVRQRDFRAFHPDVDAERKWHETRGQDFRTVEGLTRAFRTQTFDLSSGEVISTVTVRELRVNPQLDPGIFERP
jgi:hypothetical protein